MKLLIVTQTLDKQDPILGFFHRWVEEFSKNCEMVHVLSLNVGEYELPENVEVHCLGKSEGKPKIVWLWRLWKISWQKCHDYDNVFVHMNPEYVLYGAAVWKLLRKNTGLWYTHGSVPRSLSLSQHFVQKIFTASAESCRLESDKVMVTGHGIDTEFFSPGTRTYRENGTLRLITVGRLSRVKDQLFLLKAVKELRNRGESVQFTMVGGALTDTDREYEKQLRAYVYENKLDMMVTFAGPKTQTETRDLLRGSDVFIHASETGSLDKVLLEAAAAGLLVVTTAQLAGFNPTDKEVPAFAKQVLNDQVVPPKVGHTLQKLISKIIAAY